MLIIGLMSGTSADGVDVAVVDINGMPPSVQLELIQHVHVDYTPEVQAEIFACFRPETGTVDRLSRLNVTLGQVYAGAVLTAIKAAHLSPDQIDLVSSHGQTLWYDPPTGGALGNVLALGEPAIIVEQTGITTISHVRNRDLAAGGRGAPLVSYLDWLLFRHPTKGRAIQNIGGIGNVTFLPPLTLNDVPLSFDTGPGNMIMDYCASQATDGAQSYDTDGQIAAQGHVNQGLLDELMQHPYILKKPPKTTGRELFGAQFGQTVWQRGQSLGLSPQNIVATATAFTAASISDACAAWSPWPIDELYVAGGGAFNPTLMALLSSHLGSASVFPHDVLVIPATAKESILFALLGYETWHGRPGTLPVFTGAAHPAILGSITLGRLWR